MVKRAAGPLHLFRDEQRRLLPLPADLSRRQIRQMTQASIGVVEHIRRWTAQGDTSISGLNRDAPGAFVEWQHYPANKQNLPASGFRFYYHAHEQAERIAGEHGHFHLFAPLPDRQIRDQIADFAHIIGISIDYHGLPMRLFTTNRWVTNEAMQPADMLAVSLKHLDFTGAEPADLAQWLRFLVRSFQPHITALLAARDDKLVQLARRRQRSAVLEDRRIGILSQCRIDLSRHIDALQRLNESAGSSARPSAG
jgi:hypothetical protein